jgi:hypothetical protein
MLNPEQRKKLIDSIPTDLGGTIVNKQRKDRFKDPGLNAYPSMRVSITSESIPFGTSTFGTTWRSRSGPNGDVEQRIGGIYRGTCSILLEAATEKAGTDDNIVETLDVLQYYLSLEIENNRLGLNFGTDKIKIIPGSIKPNYLPPWHDEHSHIWVYPVVLDFGFTYEFSAIDPTPNIHEIDIDIGVESYDKDNRGERSHILGEIFVKYIYKMDIILKGSAKPIKFNILNKKEVSTTCGFGITLVNDND